MSHGPQRGAGALTFTALPRGATSHSAPADEFLLRYSEGSAFFSSC